MRNAAIVFFGGGLGASARYILAGVVYRWWGTDFPYGTLVVNVLGSFAIGLLAAALEGRFLANPGLRVFLTIGLLGGFTTFSTFSYETLAMLRDGELLRATLNVLLSVFLCLGGAHLGSTLARLM